ncbi:MAG: aldo/keto reductase [Armatimonadetes bacterium]|nr:aldo/keto reductase [Armatimonadota bacterium]
MERRQFGKTDMQVSVLGFGGSEIGFGGTAQSDVEVILNEALDNGMNVIDTGECYADSEEKIGKAVGHRRDDYWLFTKCGHTSGLPGEDWEPDMLRKSIDRSLQRLQTDRLDLIQLHTCSIEVLDRGEAIQVIQEAKAAGKARYIGYSGDGQTMKHALGLGVFDAIQTSVNFADQECIDLTLPLAKAQGLGVIAKRPVANVAWRHKTGEEAGYGRVYWERLQELKYLYPEMFDACLRFTISQDIHVAIVGASKPERFAENEAIVAKGVLDTMTLNWIRNRWKEVAKPDWVGQT